MSKTFGVTGGNLISSFVYNPVRLYQRNCEL